MTYVTQILQNCSDMPEWTHVLNTYWLLLLWFQTVLREKMLQMIDFYSTFTSAKCVLTNRRFKMIIWLQKLWKIFKDFQIIWKLLITKTNKYKSSYSISISKYKGAGYTHSWLLKSSRTKIIRTNEIFFSNHKQSVYPENIF